MIKRFFILFSLALPCILPGQTMLFFSQDSLSQITSPLDVDSIFYWFAADDGVLDSLGGSIATDEGVGTWTDYSGNGHDITMDTNTYRPVWKQTGGPGSMPAIQFDGSNDYLRSAAHWWGSDDLTIFVVMKFGNATRDATEFICGKYESSSNNRQFNWAGRNTLNGYEVAFYGSDDGSSDIVDAYTAVKTTNYSLYSFVYETSTDNNNLYVDGTNNTISTNAVNSAIHNSSVPKFGVGALNVTGTPSSFLQGSISEIIVYSKDLTTAERQAIESYLNIKYDLY